MKNIPGVKWVDVTPAPTSWMNSRSVICVVHEWFVDCPLCGEACDADSHDLIDDTKRGYAKYLREHGWVNTKKYGWVCGECAKGVSK